MEVILGMTLGQIFGGITGIIVVLSIFIEITPVKVNPVSWFLKWVGSKTNTELMDNLTAMGKRVSALEETVSTIRSDDGERDAIGCRIRILQFGDELRRGLRHSKENFDQVLSDIDDYEAYCEAHPEFKNSKTIVTNTKILDEYSRCIDSDDFL